MKHRSVTKPSELIALVIIFLLLSLSTSFAERGQAPFKDSEIICKMMPGVSIDVINSDYGTTIKKTQAQTGCYLLEVPEGTDAEALAAEIDARPDVLFCHVNFYLTAPEPYQRSQPFIDVQAVGDIVLQDAVVTLAVPEAQEISDGEGVNIAIIDAGADFSHPYLATGTGDVISAWDYVDDDPTAFDEPGGPATGHGTFIAGLYKLVVPGSDLYIFRVLDTLGGGDGYNIADAILQAIDDSCRVINLSLGMIGMHDAIDEALKLAKRSNVTVVAAAGNDSTDMNLVFPFPAERTYCLAVAALDSNLIKADFSNYGVKVDVCAPGTQIYGPYPDNLYAWWDGTSFAAPFVGGLAAMIYSSYPEVSWDVVNAAITGSAIGVDSLNPGLEDLLGEGLIDLSSALGFVGGFNPLGTDCNGNMIDDMIDLFNGELNDIDGDGFPDDCIEYTCGDLNQDGIVNLLDIIFYIDYKFKDGPEFYPLGAGDVNDDNDLNLLDILYLIQYKFEDGPPPACD